MRVPVDEIHNAEYGQYGLSSEPSSSDVATALAADELEIRGFQDDIDSLNAEWNAGSVDIQTYCIRMRQYHARRVAYFVNQGTWRPITLAPDGRHVKDGLHRLKAAIYLGHKEIDASIE